MKLRILIAVPVICGLHGAQRTFKKLDKDGDGKISAAEFAGKNAKTR